MTRAPRGKNTPSALSRRAKPGRQIEKSIRFVNQRDIDELLPNYSHPANPLEKPFVIQKHRTYVHTWIFRFTLFRITHICFGALLRTKVSACLSLLASIHKIYKKMRYNSGLDTRNRAKVYEIITSRHLIYFLVELLLYFRREIQSFRVAAMSTLYANEICAMHSRKSHFDLLRTTLRRRPTLL